MEEKLNELNRSRQRIPVVVELVVLAIVVVVAPIVVITVVVIVVFIVMVGLLVFNFYPKFER